jgi:hypothetical protein
MTGGANAGIATLPPKQPVPQQETAAPDLSTTSQTQQPPVPTAVESAKTSGIEDLFGKYQSGLEHQHDINAYLGLLSAGLGMMGGTSPYAFANIGKGAQQGLGTYMGLEQQTGSEEKALLAARAAENRAQELAKYRQENLEMNKEYQKSRLAQGTQTQEDRAAQRASSLIAKMETDAVNDARLKAANEIKAGSADLTNPMTDERSRQIIDRYEAAARRNLRTNPVYVQQSKIAIPGYDPSAVSISDKDLDLVNKNRTK